ncbi:glucosyltransferase domain-containing protein [Virgibacillus sediminis]|uniref:Glucosyltransferase domain-containing protein n=1 Tax=Virgibacillus sediminis TaxID=202260 RepID=A0ABV7A3W7_9BACI
MPEDFFSNFNRMLKREWKIAFISAVIIGFLTHMFVFTNALPNHDGILNIYSEQKKYTSGRFFLGPVSGVGSYFDLPWINGLLSMVYLALIAVFLTEFFKLTKKTSIVLTAGLIVTFPTVASTFSYMFTADAYMAGFLLGVLAVWMTGKYKYGFLPASTIVYVSVGIYQANLTLILTLVTVWMVTELIKNTLYKPLFLLLSKYMVMTTIGMGLYAVTFKLYQRYEGMTNYQGLDQVGMSLGNVGEQLREIIDTFKEFLFRGFFTDYPVNLFEILNVLLIVAIVAGLIISIIVHKVALARIGLIVIGFVLLPVFSFFLYFVSPAVSYHMLMVMSLAIIYILPIILYDRMHKPLLSVQWFSWGTVILAALIIFNFSIISNIAYFNMNLKYEKSYGYTLRILDRIEQTEGYENADTLAVIGYPNVETDLGSNTVPQSIPSMTGAMGDIFLSQTYQFSVMLHHFIGENIEAASNGQLEELQGSRTLEQMDAWPAESSVRVVDDTVIVKLR